MSNYVTMMFHNADAKQELVDLANVIIKQDHKNNFRSSVFSRNEKKTGLLLQPIVLVWTDIKKDYALLIKCCETHLPHTLFCSKKIYNVANEYYKKDIPLLVVRDSEKGESIKLWKLTDAISFVKGGNVMVLSEEELHKAIFNEFNRYLCRIS